MYPNLVVTNPIRARGWGKVSRPPHWKRANLATRRARGRQVRRSISQDRTFPWRGDASPRDQLASLRSTLKTASKYKKESGECSTDIAAWGACEDAVCRSQSRVVATANGQLLGVKKAKALPAKRTEFSNSNIYTAGVPSKQTLGFAYFIYRIAVLSSRRVAAVSSSRLVTNA